MNTRRIASHALSIALCAGLLLGPGVATTHAANDVNASSQSTPSGALAVEQTVSEETKKATAKPAKKRRRGRKKARRAARRQKRHDKAIRKIARKLNRGVELRAIDSAYDAGSLTWQEAKGLYAEQAIVRRSVMNNRVRKTGSIKRVRFIRDTAKTTLVRLKHNLAQRIYVMPAEPVSQEGERAVAQTGR